ncbi:SDR family NAD(P)-dependent oxidoreductase [Nonomuraea sp. C10]|uniref:SDR family NAD(P)-dependent oxidoreductase n=1 Tax=Nonomuraea sp. C10 TaxID=2600577 RepID=UPI0011CEA9BA|nr:SDR family NAD(P)-dependent oxidoreductase [Nonomuraea sp. C10]TXK38969.1 SDR family NAD(P)-dependent oxidoreductase [Nonomuraea sp. C10]
MPELDFDGAVAVVTGAGHGLGRAYAGELGRRGARVLVNDLDPEAARSAARDIADAGGVAVAETSSVADPAGGEAIIAAAVDAFGRVDVLINNAGVGRPKDFGDVGMDDVHLSLSVHLLGAYHLIVPAWRHMAAQGGGSIVNTSSSVGLFGQKRSAVYASAKMGVVGLTRVLAAEGAPLGIRVNAIAPVASSRMAADVYGKLDPKLDPARVAAVVLALAHRDCQVTGEVVSAGGGRLSRILIATTDGYFSPDLTVEEAAAALPSVVAGETAVRVPTCAMDEIDLIRQCFPDLDGFPMPMR